MKAGASQGLAAIIAVLQKLNLSAVESRIKMQVAADKAAAKQRQDARQRAIQSAMKAAATGGMRETLLQVRNHRRFTQT
jgi:hypothetical protein